MIRLKNRRKICGDYWSAICLAAFRLAELVLRFDSLGTPFAERAPRTREAPWKNGDAWPGGAWAGAQVEDAGEEKAHEAAGIVAKTERGIKKTIFSNYFTDR